MSEILSVEDFERLLDSAISEGRKSHCSAPKVSAAYRGLHERQSGPVIGTVVAEVIAELTQCLGDAQDEHGVSKLGSKDRQYYSERIPAISALLERLKSAESGPVIEAWLTSALKRDEYILWPPWSAPAKFDASKCDLSKEPWESHHDGEWRATCGAAMIYAMKKSVIPASMRLEPGGGPVKVWLPILPADPDKENDDETD